MQQQHDVSDQVLASNGAHALAHDVPPSDTATDDRDAVVARLNAGEDVAPCFEQGADGRARFVSAAWLFVSFAVPASRVGKVIDHAYTRDYASVICRSESDDGGSVDCLIGFALPNPITRADAYLDHVVGLATVYGANVADSTTGWRMPPGGTAQVYTGRLSKNAAARLRMLGREWKSAASVARNGYGRSRVRLAPDQLVQDMGGEMRPLQSLDAGVSIHCPMHVDCEGCATVIKHGDARGVQCPQCARNYWSFDEAQAGLHQFRDFFERMYEAERAQNVPENQRQFVLLHERYLPSLQLSRGVTMVRSPTGSGKTEALKKLVQDARAKGLRILLVGHRRGLLHSLARRLELDLYFELQTQPDGEVQVKHVDVTEAYAICLDSMANKLRPGSHKFDLLIVDEAEQVVRHLMGGTLAKQRRAAFNIFQHYVQAASYVYFLDADLDRLTQKFVALSVDATTDVRYIVNEPAVQQRQYDLVTTRESLLARLGQALTQGRRCFVTTNSKERAKKTELWIREQWPGKRAQLVDSDNVQTPEVQALLSDVAGAYKGTGGRTPLDVLVTSPTVGTGVDITFADNAVGVDCVFGLFECGVNTHYDIDQQLARVRNPGSVTVWVNRNVTTHETAPEAVKAELLRTVLRTDGLVRYSREGAPICTKEDEPVVELWAEIVAMERASKNRLYDNWVNHRQRSGWVPLTETRTEEELAQGKQALSVGTELREAEKLERIQSAAQIDEERAKDLVERDQNNANLTDDERASLDRWRLEKFYAAEVDADLIRFDDSGRTRRKIDMLETLIGDETLNRNADLHDMGLKKTSPSVIPFDRRFKLAKAEVMGQLLAAAGLLDINTGEFNCEVLVHTGTLDAFRTYFRANHARIDSELGLDMRRDIDRKPVQQLGEVLDLIGVNLEAAKVVKEHGQKIRMYRLDATQLMEILACVVRRSEQRQSDWSERVDAGMTEMLEFDEDEREDDSGGDNCAAIHIDDKKHQLSPVTRSDSLSSRQRLDSQLIARVFAHRQRRGDAQASLAHLQPVTAAPFNPLDVNEIPFKI